MDAQLLVVLLLVAVAAAYLLHRAMRSWRKDARGGCGGSCSCEGKNEAVDAKVQAGSFIPSEQLSLRSYRHGH